jgi:hypothetical protein
MKKTIYVAIADRINGDRFDLCATYDKAEAIRAIEQNRNMIFNAFTILHLIFLLYKLQLD